MKEKLLQFVVCPFDKSQLSLKTFLQESDEILDGLLTSENGRVYPIISGVPRILPDNLLAHLPEDHPEYIERYQDLLPSNLQEVFKQANFDVQRHTQSAFGHEWTWANDYAADNFADWLPEPFTSVQLFSDKIGLEIGCGAGRHAVANASLAKEHIATDLSIAVDSAFQRVRAANQENCHIVQADAFHLPFRENSFDYVYCLGVIQHMHNPPEGFVKLAVMTKRSGILLVNVYQKGRPILMGILNIMRSVTTRLPNRVLQPLCSTLGYLEYFSTIWPWKMIRNTALGKFIEPAVPIRIKEYSKHSLKTCVVDWFDRLSCPVKIHYSDKELASWYVKAGYHDIIVKPYWKAFWNGYGIRT